MSTSEATIGWTRPQMAERAAQDIPNGSYVNLGIGIPELITQFVPEGRELIYHGERIARHGPVASRRRRRAGAHQRR